MPGERVLRRRDGDGEQQTLAVRRDGGPCGPPGHLVVPATVEDMALFRRSALPDDVRNRLGLARHERVLGHGRLTDGWAVATTQALLVVGDDEPTRRPWTDVVTARLDPEDLTVTVEWVDSTEPLVLHLKDEADREFPAILRQCVDSSVVHRERVTLPDRTVVQVALRRDGHGRLFTQVIGPGRVDLDDPAVAEAVDAAELRVREAAGL